MWIGNRRLDDGTNFVDSTFENCDLTGGHWTLDGNRFARCRMRNVVLRFGGVGPVYLVDNDVTKFAFALYGPAAAAVRQLVRLYAESPARAALVEQLFDHIRSRTDPRATLRLLSWEHLRTEGAARLVAFLTAMRGEGGEMRAAIESLFADIRAQDFRILEPDEFADEQALYNIGTGYRPPSEARLRLRFTHAAASDPATVADVITDVIRALSALHVAEGGSGLRLDEARGVGSAAAPAGVLV